MQLLVAPALRRNERTQPARQRERDAAPTNLRDELLLQVWALRQLTHEREKLRVRQRRLLLLRQRRARARAEHDGAEDERGDAR
ncbi:MAG: hypothetical protein DMF65_10605 [Acidobacteria bacterium]|nr:MAG: hypothetical protein DMF65_10605 [Acidobacteriota bacterium]